MNEIEAIKEFLCSHRVHISSEWLIDCIQWCKEEALPPNHSLRDLKEKVFEQWLLLDLRDVEETSLPPKLSSRLKFSLNGIYFVQIMEIVDISKPKYWQIQKIRNETPKNLENENINSKRMLMLTLTDGVQEIKSMEMKPIPSLNLNINPGLKIKLIGPIMVRRGILLLEEHNIKIIGGEVDTLLISNAAENILARDLNLQLNPNPLRIQESMVAKTIEITSDSQINPTNRINQVANIQSSNEHIINNQNVVNSSIAKNVTNIQNKRNIIENEFDEIDNFFEDEDKINEEIEMIMELERTMNKPKSRNTKQKTPDISDNMEIDDYSFETTVFPNTPKKSNRENLVDKNDVLDDDLTGSLEDGMDIFEKLDVNIDTNISRTDKRIEKQRTSVISDLHKRRSSSDDFILVKDPTNSDTIQAPLPKINVWSIERLNNKLPNINNGKFKIKAKFKSIVEKLSVIDEMFHLIVEVEDESGSIVVKIHNDVVSTLAGCTAANLLRLKSQDNVVQTQSKILDVLKFLKDNLINFNSLVEVMVNSKEKFPILIKI